MGSGVGKANGYQTTHFSATPRATSSTPTPQPESGQGSSTSSGDNPQSPAQPLGLRPSTSSQQTDDAEMVCEACSASFNLFKRKHRCMDCDKFFCANCIHKEPRKCCFTCRIFEGLSTRGDVMGVKLKDLRQFLSARNISIETCREKADLVDLVTQHLGLPTAPHILPINQTSSTSDLPDRQSDTSATSTSAETIPITEPNSVARPTQSSGMQETTGQPTVHIYGETPLGPMRHAWNDSSPEAEASPENSQGMDEPEFPEIINIPTQQENTQSTTTSQSQTQQSQTSTEVPIRRQRASVSDLKSALDIESLSIKQLKEILARNFVDYKGCVERYELEERVTRLFNEKESFRQKEEKAAAEKNDGKGTSDDILDLDPEICCKICMDAPIDCVLLECGHMVTCSKCGKRLAECPICRQYVVRAVHVFKS